jgi:hypothetical protein
MSRLVQRATPVGPFRAAPLVTSPWAWVANGEARVPHAAGPGSSERARGMEKEYAERSTLERRIADAGWHILRDQRVPDGYLVEFQQGPPSGYHLHAQTRKSKGRSRAEAYRRFLAELGVPFAPMYR